MNRKGRGHRHIAAREVVARNQSMAPITTRSEHHRCCPNSTGLRVEQRHSSFGEAPTLLASCGPYRVHPSPLAAVRWSNLLIDPLHIPAKPIPLIFIADMPLRSSVPLYSHGSHVDRAIKRQGFQNMNLRQERGKNIAETRSIRQQKGLWMVPSEQTKYPLYKVNLNSNLPTCTCADYEKRKRKCKHIYAAEYASLRKQNSAAQKKGNVAPTIVREKAATYPQKWPAYNKAQTTEKEMFLCLLSELCAGIRDEHKPGRPPIPLSEAVFCAAYKVYSTFPARRFMTDLRSAQREGYITETPCHNTVLGYIAKPEITGILKELIVESSLPLQAVETCFAADSTGFSSYQYNRWYSHKYGKEKSKSTWIKGHVMCGVVTNVITAVEVHDQYAHDSLFLPSLLSITKDNFHMGEISADKAYLSESNLVAIYGAGATPFIPLKSNTIGYKGSQLRTLYHRFMAEQDKFLAHYHKRSNVETTFSMIKRKFGSNLRSKSETAMVNETLLKFLCHNIVVLIHEFYERGVEPAFWQKKAA